MSFHYVFDNHILMLICRSVSISYGTFLRPSPFAPKIFWPSSKNICLSMYEQLQQRNE